MTKALVTVVVPAYNREAVIARAIQSVLDQTFQNFEIIIVDDASTDRTCEIVLGYNDSRIRLLRHQTNLFAGAARNTGMNSAQGQYIAFLDSDDEWESTKLEKQVALLEQHSELGCATCGFTYAKGRGIVEKTIIPQIDGDVLVPYLLHKIIIITPSVMFRAKILEEIGLMDVTLKRNQDVDFLIRLLNATKLGIVKEPLVTVYQNATPPKLETIEESNRILLSKNEELINGIDKSLLGKIQSNYWFRHGQRYFSAGQFKNGCFWITKAIRRHPQRPFLDYAKAAVRMFYCPIAKIRRGFAKGKNQ